MVDSSDLINFNSRFNLNGKFALITGAAGLLGRQHAIALLKARCNVILTDIDYENLLDVASDLKIHYSNQQILIKKINVADEHSVYSAMRNLKDNRIYVDILVNNAAMDPKSNALDYGTRLENFSIERWNQEISVGLTGAMICAKVFGTEMSRSGKGGVILNIASDLGVIAPDQRIYKSSIHEENGSPVKPVTYSVIKFGIIGLTKYLSTYWNDKGVRVNSLSPGGIFHNQDKEFVEKVSKLIPLGRMARVNEYQETIQYLCSDASSYLHGHNLVVDGGRSVW